MQVDCEGCGAVLRLKEEFIGRRVKCPKCGTSQLVPEPELERSPYDDDPLFTISSGPTPPPVHQSLRSKLEPPPVVNPGPVAGVGTQANTAGGPWGAYQSPASAAPSAETASALAQTWSISPGKIALGLLMMLGAVVWFVLGLAADRIFFYPPLLFIIGIASVIKGFLSQSEQDTTTI